MTADAPKSTGAMMSDILGNVSNLVRNEADLARAEIAESLKRAGGALAAMAMALALAITGLNVLAASLVTVAIRFGVPPDFATFGAGAILLLIALAIFSAAKTALQQIGFVPTRAARNVVRDAAVIKDTRHDT